MAGPLRICAPLVLLVASCGSDAECAVDTDCPLFNRCEAQQCLPIGGVDSGPSPDTGPPPMDAGGGLDGGSADSGVADSGSPIDAGGPDANFDCSSLPGSYLVEAAACGVAEGTPVVVSAPDSDCVITFSSVGAAISGTTTLDASGVAEDATISIGGMADQSCRVTAASGQIQLDCRLAGGDCTAVLLKVG